MLVCRQPEAASVSCESTAHGRENAEAAESRRTRIDASQAEYGVQSLHMPDPSGAPSGALRPMQTDKFRVGAMHLPVTLGGLYQNYEFTGKKVSEKSKVFSSRVM